MAHREKLRESRRTNGFLARPREEHGASFVRSKNFPNVRQLILSSQTQQRLVRVAGCKALVNDPPERLNPRPAEIGLQRLRFMHRRCFGKRHQQHTGKIRIP